QAPEVPAIGIRRLATGSPMGRFARAGDDAGDPGFLLRSPTRMPRSEDRAYLEEPDVPNLVTPVEVRCPAQAGEEGPPEVGMVGGQRVQDGDQTRAEARPHREGHRLVQSERRQTAPDFAGGQFACRLPLGA